MQLSVVNQREYILFAHAAFYHHVSAKEALVEKRRISN